MVWKGTSYGAADVEEGGGEVWKWCLQGSRCVGGKMSKGFAPFLLLKVGVG